MTHEYVVQPGDNLSQIAADHGLSLGEVQSANKDLGKRLPPWGINPGDRVLLPTPESPAPLPSLREASLPVGRSFAGAASKLQARPVTPLSNRWGKALAQLTSGTLGRSTRSQPPPYTVQLGDNLSSIAARHDLTLGELQAANPDLEARDPPWGINPGDTIEFPPELPPISKTDPVTSGSAPCLQCGVTLYAMRCKHDRRYNLQIPPGSEDGVNILEVIASSNKMKESVTITMAGHCDNNRKDCPRIRVRSAVLPVQEGTKELAARIALPDIPFTDFGARYAYFFKHILIPRSNPTVYEITWVRCDGAETREAEVHAFPSVEWNGGVTLGFTYETQADSNFNANIGYSKLRVEGKWELDVDVDVTCDEHKWSLTPIALDKSAGRYSNNAVSSAFFRGVQGFLDKVTPIFTSMLPFKKTSTFGTIEVKMPKLKLAGGMRSSEKKGARTLQTVGNITLSLTPLIGVTVKADILNWLIAFFAAGPTAKLLLDVKRRLSEGIGNDVAKVKADLAIELSGSMDFGGEFKWSFSADKWETSGGVTADFKFAIEGRASVEIQVFVFKAGAGAKVGAETGLSGTLSAVPGKSGPEIGGKLTFSGITVYYAYYAEVGGATMAPGENRKRPKKGVGVDADSIGFKDEMTNKDELVPATSWPDTPSNLTLDGD